MKKALRSPVLYVVLAGVMILIGVQLFRPRAAVKHFTLNEFEQRVSSGQVASATLHDGSNKLTGRLKGPGGVNSGAQYDVTYPDRFTSEMTQMLLDRGVAQVSAKHSKSPLWVSLLLNFAPILLLFGGFIFILNSMLAATCSE